MPELESESEFKSEQLESGRHQLAHKQVEDQASEELLIDFNDDQHEIKTDLNHEEEDLNNIMMIKYE